MNIPFPQNGTAVTRLYDTTFVLETSVSMEIGSKKLSHAVRSNITNPKHLSGEQVLDMALASLWRRLGAM